MNNKLMALAAGALLAVSGSAYADYSVSSFPPMRPQVQNAPAQQGMMRAPLNRERNRGLKVFGATSVDYNIVRHFVNYYSNEYLLENLSWISREDESGVANYRNIHMINAGAYNPDDGNYYAYKVEYYTIGITFACQWLKVNPVTGEWSVITPLASDMHDSTYLYDMAYSIYDGEMYGLVQNSDGQVKSKLGLLSLEDSSLSDLVQLPEYYYAVAFDLNGTLYGIRWDYDEEGILRGTRLDTFDSNFKVVKSAEVLVNGEKYKAYFQNGLAYDYTTGKLVWSATDDEGNQRMVLIDPNTAETTLLGRVGFNEVMIGLHVPFEKASDVKAPAVVDGLTASPSRDGSQKVTINWTNPTVTWNRSQLTDLTKVRVYRDTRDSKPVAELDMTGKEGERGQYVDSDAPKGVRKYIIVPVNAAGEGVPAEVEVYSGRDVPGCVQDLKVESVNSGKGAKVSWNMPAKGDSEGWYDNSDLKYTVTRNPGNTVVAKDIAETSYEDTMIPEAMYYTYTVTAKNAEGEGSPAVSEGILAGSSLMVPFSTDFQSQNEANRFQSLDPSGFNSQFTYSSNNIEGKTMCMKYDYANTNNAILLSPAFNLKKGKKYRVVWNYTLGRFGHSFKDYYNHFRLVGGAERTYEGVTSTVIADFDNQLTEKSKESFTVDGYFESPVDGDFSVGLQILTQSKNEDAWMYVTGFSIVESADDDLEAAALVAPALVSSQEDNYFYVDVYNNGSNDQSAYKVEVGVASLNGSFVPFAETSDVPAVKSHETQRVLVKGKGNFSDVQDLQARVTLQGDGNLLNNMSPMTEVKFYTGVPYNYHASDDRSAWTSASYPFYLYTTYSATQSLYPMSKFGFEKEANEINGLAWEYTSESDVDDVSLKVYLGKTADGEFDKNPKIIGNQQLVFEGTVNMYQGTNWLAVSFPEKPFVTSDNKGNLVVTVVSEEKKANGSWPAQFNVYNSTSSGPDRSDGLYHSIYYNGEAPFSFTDSKVYRAQELAVLHVGAKGSTGVCSPAADGVAPGVRLAGRTLSIYGDAEMLSVYDMSGRLALCLDVKGVSSVELPFAAGIYAVRLSDAAGNVAVSKIAIK